MLSTVLPEEDGVEKLPGKYVSHLYHTLSNWLPHTFGLERNPHPRCQAHHAKT